LVLTHKQGGILTRDNLISGNSYEFLTNYVAGMLLSTVRDDSVGSKESNSCQSCSRKHWSMVFVLSTWLVPNAYASS